MGASSSSIRTTRAAASDALRLQAERYTAEAPYTFTVEARTADGDWRQVWSEGAQTPVGQLRALAFRRLDRPVKAYRFRCTSAKGVLVTDRVQTLSFNGFFND